MKWNEKMAQQERINMGYGVCMPVNSHIIIIIIES